MTQERSDETSVSVIVTMPHSDGHSRSIGETAERNAEATMEGRWDKGKKLQQSPGFGRLWQMSSQSFSIVFLGTSSFALPSLQELVRDPVFDVRLVVTQPDKPAGRSKTITPPPVKTLALKLGIPVLQPEKITRSGLAKAAPFDFLVVVSYGQILEEPLLALPRIAPINVHASLLPRWRGASPLQQTILAGDRESGVTIQRMVRDLDAGPVLAQKRMLLDARETAMSLGEKLANVGALLLLDTLKKPLQEHVQNPTGITLCRTLKKEDGRVELHVLTAEEIDCRVRGLTPWPGVTTTYRRQEVKLLKTSLIPTKETAALPCRNDTTLYLGTVQPAGKKPMTGAAWLRGVRASP